jgi:hypothetical protein
MGPGQTTSAALLLSLLPVPTTSIEKPPSALAEHRAPAARPTRPPTPGARPVTYYLDRCGARKTGFGVDTRLRRAGTDVVVSTRHRFVYVDNVKAASTTIRNLIDKALHITWLSWAGVLPRPPARFNRRLSTRDLLRAAVRGYFFFSFVREPWSRFAAGIDQARYYQQRVTNQSVMELIRSSDTFRGPDEHLASNLRRLGGVLADGRHRRLDFIGRVESFAHDWPYAVSRMHGLSDAQRAKLLAPLPRRASREGGTNTRAHDRGAVNRSAMAPGLREEVRAFCALRAADFECLGYDLPPACLRSHLRRALR